MVINSEFWRDKKVFLTGNTGFKGSWLTIWLLEMGANIIGYSKDIPTLPSLFEQAGLQNRIVHHTGDVQDYHNLFKKIKESTAEIIIHMAAQPLVRRSYENPKETFATNVMGTVHILDSIRNLPAIKSGVIITTDKCYENRDWEIGYKETDPMGGADPYSGSKGAAELVISSYINSYFKENGQVISSARAGNVIGGGDWAEDRLVPDIIKSIITGEKLLIRNPDAIRPWQHVLEPLSGYLLLAERGYNDENGCDNWNFGPQDDDARSVQWLAKKMSSYFGIDKIWELDGENHPPETNYLKLNSSKARNKLNWTPAWNVDLAIEKTSSWYKDFYSGRLNSAGKVYQRCVNDINEYSDDLK